MGGFCKYCVMQNVLPWSQKKQLVTAPFQKLDKAIGKDGVLERHQSTNDHKLAVDAVFALIHLVENPKKVCHI